MIFPESLYLLSPRDQEVTWLDPVAARGTLNQAATSVTISLFTVPQGRYLVLSQASAIAQPGAAQNVDQFQIDYLHLTDFYVIAIDNTAKAANIRASLNWNGQILIPPAATVRVVGSFNAAVAANTVGLWINGILIPAANIQR